MTATTMGPITAPAQSRPAAFSLPVFRETMNSSRSETGRLVLITHILDTAVAYVREIARAFEIIDVVPVPYSARSGALAQLDGLPVTLPASVEQIGTIAIASALRAADGVGTPIVIHDVGGYCTERLDELATHPTVRGVVEDTRQGQWRYERRPLPMPVFTIADSPLKALEDIQVGRAIASSLDRLIRDLFFEVLAERRVLVLGYGGIGTSLAKHLRQSDVRVAVFDPDDIRMAAALLHGYHVGERCDVLGWADVIVGVSGHTSLTAGDVTALKDGVVLASGSSKQIEFDITGMRTVATEVASTPLLESLTFDGRTVFVLNEGYPINFIDQSVLGSVLDLVYSELYLCTNALLSRTHSPGLHRIDRASQNELARRWHRHYGTGLGS